MARMVNCVKIGRELPGLDYMPVKGELGERIFENVSAEAWELWKDYRIILINHYGLNMVDPNAQDFMREQMNEFFFSDDAALPEGWTPPAQSGSSKGAPAPRRK